MIWEVHPSPYGGLQLAALNMLKHLSKRHTIRLIYLDTKSEAATDYPDLEPYCSHIDSVAREDMSHGRQVLSVARDSLSARKLLSEYRWFFTPAYSPLMAELVQEALRRDKYDVIYASNQVAFYAWPFSTPKVVHAFDCVSVACYKQWREAQRASAKAYWFLAYLANTWTERKILQSFDDCMVVSDEEYAAFKALFPNVKCSVIPLGVDTEFFKPSTLSEEWPSLVFAGDMSYGPNVKAIQYFHSQIYPPLKERFAGLKLFVVGKRPAEAVRSLDSDPSIIVTGFVDDVRPYLARASVVIAPFISGSGTKTKVLEAMAMGKPVVTSSIGVRGINAIHGDTVYVADSPAAFTDHIQELLDDDAKRKRMGDRAREFVEKCHSWNRVAEEVDHIFQRAQTGDCHA
jgi:glycosyltransferase involved in cell wall biosynthesis